MKDEKDVKENLLPLLKLVNKHRNFSPIYGRNKRL